MQRWFRRATAARQDDNQRRSLPVRGRTRPSRLPSRWSWVSARAFPDRTFARVPYRKRRWRQIRFRLLGPWLFFFFGFSFVVVKLLTAGTLTPSKVATVIL